MRSLIPIRGNFFNRSWFALDKSRGLDHPDLKLYMRATVLISEYLVYIPAAVILTRRFARAHGIHIWDCSIALTALLLQPSTILIDHGHFQYNTVMLGFVLATISRLYGGSPLWACFYFVSALGFKQMALFYAPAIFAYLLGSCLLPKLNSGRFLGIALATIASFAMLYGPFLAGVMYDQYRGISVSDYQQPPQLQSLLHLLPFPINKDSIIYPTVLQLTQSIHRIFPFSRGLFEDKVANLWCSLHQVHKLNRYNSTILQRLALLSTLATCLPPSVILFLRPRKDLITLGFTTCAWAFFLCSYQVHEKNVLLPLLPMTLLLAEHGGLRKETRRWVGFANILGAWTMFPLLKRDGLRVPYFVLTGLWAWLMGLPPFSLDAYYVPFWSERGTIKEQDADGKVSVGELVTTAPHLACYAAMVLWHVVEAFVAPPFDKPDLWVVANVVVGAGGFASCYAWCLWQLLMRSGLLHSQVKAKTQ
jgi:alpha-1,3-glucosyltransferase